MPPELTTRRHPVNLDSYPHTLSYVPRADKSYHHRTGHKSKHACLHFIPQTPPEIEFALLNQGEGVDLQRNTGDVINVGWTEPGEWISYTVQYPGNETAVQDVSVRCERFFKNPLKNSWSCPTAGFWDY